MDRQTPPLVAAPWLHVAPLLVAAACWSDEGPTSLPGAGQHLYVTNYSLAPGVMVYGPGASGNVVPIRTITGHNTALENAAGIARDAAGTLYVANPPHNPPYGGSITVYAPEASQNAVPIRTITGGGTGLYNPRGIAVDRAGHVYASNTYTVTVYAPGASGNAPPIRTIESYFQVGGVALDSAGNVYVSSRGGIAVYAVAAEGATPIRTIAGSNILLQCPAGMGLDAAGELYVADPCGGSISVYAPESDGNAAPVRTIAGSNTGLNGPFAVALDAAGNVYVTNTGGYTANAGSVTVYAPGASGNAPPVRTLAGCNTGIGYPWGPRGVALDPDGNVYVTAHVPAFGITAYMTTTSGTPVLTHTITGCNTELNGPLGIARDAADNLYVANLLPSTITVYAPGASGDVVPIRTIAGANTGLNDPNGIALDAASNLYVANWPSSITVYAAGATGDVAPIRTITGLHTRLAFPTGIAVDAAGRLYVANKGQNGNDATVTVYAAGATGDVSPIATITGNLFAGPTYPQRIAVDGGGRVYLADAVYPAPVVRVYAPDETGKFALRDTIAGSNTGLTGFIEGIALDSVRQIYVASGKDILVFAPNARGNVAPLATVGGANSGLSGPTYLTF